ncbi:hypothetical protein HAV_00152 [Candidatus Hepatincola sp. Av]
MSNKNKISLHIFLAVGVIIVFIIYTIEVGIEAIDLIKLIITDNPLSTMETLLFIIYYISTLGAGIYCIYFLHYIYLKGNLDKRIIAIIAVAIIIIEIFGEVLKSGVL